MTKSSAREGREFVRNYPGIPREVWCMIFVQIAAEEEAKETNVRRHGSEVFRQPDRTWIRWLLDTRFVCHDFDDAIVPIVYETINISTTYLNKRRVPNKQIKGHLASFSKYLHLPHEPIIVYKQNPIDLIKNCKNLTHIQWTVPERWFIKELKHFTNRPEKEDPEWQNLTLRYLIAFLQASKSNKQFHLGMYKQSVSVTKFSERSESRRAIVRDLISDVFEEQASDIIEVVSPEQDLTRDDLEDTSLELLYVTAYHRWDPYFAHAGFTLPTMHSLILKCTSYANSSFWDFLNILDFTMLERMALLDVQVNHLLKKVPVGRFSNVRALHLTVSAYPNREMERNNGTLALRELFGTFCQLDTLYVSFFQSWMDILPLSVIVKAGKSLRKLSLRDTKNGSHPFGKDMRALSVSCPNIEELTVDIDLKKSTKSAELLSAFAAFPNLHTLDLHSSSSPDGPDHEIYDDRFRAAALVSTLCANKQGVKFRRITFHLRWIGSTKHDAWKEPTHFDRFFRTLYCEFDEAGYRKEWDTTEVLKGKLKKKQKGVEGGSEPDGYESDSTAYGELGTGSKLRLA